MVLSPMFTFQVHKFRDSQSGGGDLELNTCAKHICLRAVVADDLVDILCGFLIVMPVKRGLVAPQNIFIQTIIKKFDGSRKSVKLLLHIDRSVFHFIKSFQLPR